MSSTSLLPNIAASAPNSVDEVSSGFRPAFASFVSRLYCGWPLNLCELPRKTGTSE
jgi:hypothetical protein